MIEVTKHESGQKGEAKKVGAGVVEAASGGTVADPDDGAAFGVRELFRNPRGSHIHLPILHDGHLYLVVNENFNTQSRSRRAEGGLLCLSLAGEEVWGATAMILAEMVELISRPA